MIRIAHSVTIARPVAKVFAFASSPSNLPKWQAHVQRVRTTAGEPLRVGATYREETLIHGRPAVAQMRVIAYTPPTTFTVRSVSPGPVTVEAGYRFQSVDGGTRVQAVVQLHVYGWRRLLRPLLARSARRDFKAYLANLKRIVEAPTHER